MVEVKICGLTNLDDAKYALDAGADYLGFVFYGKSARGVTPLKTVQIMDALGGDVRLVGVFVNQAGAEVDKIARDCGLYAVQIHGDEEPDEFRGMPVPVWRAVRIESGGVKPDPAAWAAERYVVDAAVPGEYGGTGVAADWKEAGLLAGLYPLMLAGGLTPENVANAVSIVKPCGVDVASGVESRPGRKDHDKVKAFIDAVKRKD